MTAVTLLDFPALQWMNVGDECNLASSGSWSVCESLPTDLKSAITQDVANAPDPLTDVFLFHKIPHRNLGITIKPLPQSQPLIIIALGSNVQDSFDAEC